MTKNMQQCRKYICVFSPGYHITIIYNTETSVAEAGIIILTESSVADPWGSKGVHT